MIDSSPKPTSHWPPTRRQLLWAGGIAALAFLLIIVICGYLFKWPWTGLPRSDVPPNTQPTKTLWDWLDLLIVPVVLAIGGYLFNNSQNQATQRAAERRAQDDALQAYLDHMSDMLTPKKDQASLNGEPPPESLKYLARARTLTVLRRLDGDRKGRVLQFLHESRLIEGGRFLHSQYGLTEDEEGRLVRINLSSADLSEADLSEADLSGAHLSKVNLSRANLSKAFLSRANLSEADLSGAKLSGAKLGYVDLTSANVTQEQLEEVDSLEGATMPDGQTLYGEFTPDGPPFEEWLAQEQGPRGG
jgi:hypothetical protein